jgi:hypothetical protein
MALCSRAFARDPSFADARLRRGCPVCLRGLQHVFSGFKSDPVRLKHEPKSAGFRRKITTALQKGGFARKSF